MHSTECRFSLLLFFKPTSTKPRAWKLSKMLNNGCNDFLFGVHCVEEGDRFPIIIIIIIIAVRVLNFFAIFVSARYDLSKYRKLQRDRHIILRH